MSCLSVSWYQDSQFTKIFQGVGSLGAVFVCNTYQARDIDLLKEKGIQAVLSAQKQQKISLAQKQIPSYLYLEIKDDINFNIALYFEESFKFIEQNRRKTHVLVHCSQGLNCSIGLVLGYIIKKYQYTYEEAIKLVKRRYKKFKINEFNSGFAHSLKQLAVQNGDLSLIKQNKMRRRIQRVRRTYDGIARSYNKNTTTQQKLMGFSPQKNNNITMKSNSTIINNLKSQCILPCNSRQYLNSVNPEQMSQLSRHYSKDYQKHLPRKSEDQIEDEQHHRKIVSQIFLLSQQSKIFLSKRMENARSDDSVMSNYDRLKSAKKNHFTYYSPLKKYERYQMFTQNKLKLKFQAVDTIHK